jgi:hypothetical protein
LPVVYVVGGVVEKGFRQIDLVSKVFWKIAKEFFGWDYQVDYFGLMVISF